MESGETGQPFEDFAIEFRQKISFRTDPETAQQFHPAVYKIQLYQGTLRPRR